MPQGILVALLRCPHCWLDECAAIPKRLRVREASKARAKCAGGVNVYTGSQSFLATMTIIVTPRVYRIGQDLARWRTT